jgi:hypothetical protein
VTDAPPPARARQGRPPGLPKTGGRKKGTPNKVKGKATLERQAMAAVSAGETPLEFLLRVMRDVQQPMDVRIGAAKAAAPYCHRQLKAVEHMGEGGGPMQYEVVLSFG